ncbi:MAG TPA: hypothetical protein VIZ61_14465 [Solirubrobacterales bacterium]
MGEGLFAWARAGSILVAAQLESHPPPGRNDPQPLRQLGGALRSEVGHPGRPGLGEALAGKPPRVNRKLLGIYLNDHLAGSVVGSRLAKRIARQNEGNDYGTGIARIAREIEEDKATLHQLMERLGIGEQRARLAMAWVAEKAMRLKPNGNLFRYSPLSRVLELETLTMGITGKLELWRSMDAVENGNAIPGFDFTQLARRAEAQRDLVEELRVRAAEEALSGSDSQR